MPAYNPGHTGREDPSVNDPRISCVLRRFREDCPRRTPGERVAKKLGWSASKISRYECGRTGITESGLDEILQLYTSEFGMDPEYARSVRAMFERALEMAWLTHPLLGHAPLADSLHEWAPCYVPRLLQTHEYAAAVLAGMQPVTGMSPGEVRYAAAAVSRWQSRLEDEHPPELRAVIDEPVLYRIAGSPEVMRRQLERLAKVAAGEVPGIGIRVLPLSAAPAAGLPRWTPAFSYQEFATGPGQDPAVVVATDELEGPGFPELTEKQAWQRLLMFRQLWDAADDAALAVKAALASIEA